MVPEPKVHQPWLIGPCDERFLTKSEDYGLQPLKFQKKTVLPVVNIQILLKLRLMNVYSYSQHYEPGITGDHKLSVATFKIQASQFFRTSKLVGTLIQLISESG